MTLLDSRFALAAPMFLGALIASGSVQAQALEAQPADAGLLDTPITPVAPLSPGADSVAPAVNQQALADDVEDEQEELEELPAAAIEPRAEGGDRVAQSALGASFAKEAQSLANITALANDAASDALFWYGLAAGRGVPGSPAIDNTGIKAFPVRVVRDEQR